MEFLRGGVLTSCAGGSSSSSTGSSSSGGGNGVSGETYDLTTGYAAVAKSTATAPETAGTITLNDVTYNTFAEAWAAIPTSGSDTYTIKLGKGTYDFGDDVRYLYSGSNTIKISGDTTENFGADVVIQGNINNLTQNQAPNMSARELIQVSGSGDFILENVTVKSTSARSVVDENNQKEVIAYDGTGKIAAYNCTFISTQDTIRTQGKAWFYQCYIEGDVDFLWMERSTGLVGLYEQCWIVPVISDTVTKSYIATARFNTGLSTYGKGLVIYNSKITAPGTGSKNYLFRGISAEYYHNCAAVNVELENSLTAVLNSGDKKTAYAGGDKYIGFKIDLGKIAREYTSRTNLGIIDADMEADEYSGRETILNRVFNTGRLKFEKDTTNYWDIDAFVEEQGWSVAEDTSKSLLDGETEVTTTNYTFDSDLVEDGDVDCSNILSTTASEDGYKWSSDGKLGISGDTTLCHAQASGNYGLQVDTNGEIKVKVSGKCLIGLWGSESSHDMTVTYTDSEGQEQNLLPIAFTIAGKKQQDVWFIFDKDIESTVTLKATGACYYSYVRVKTYTDETPLVTEVNISQGGDTLTLSNSTEQYAATVSGIYFPSDSVKWTSSDTSVATIDESTGLLTMVKTGTTTVRATSTVTTSVYDEKEVEIVNRASSVIYYDATAEASAETVKISSGESEGIFGTLSTEFKGYCRQKTEGATTDDWEQTEFKDITLRYLTNGSSKGMGMNQSIMTSKTTTSGVYTYAYIDYEFTLAKTADVTVELGSCYTTSDTGNNQVCLQLLKSNGEDEIGSVTSSTGKDIDMSSYPLTAAGLEAGTYIVRYNVQSSKATGISASKATIGTMKITALSAN